MLDRCEHERMNECVPGKRLSARHESGLKCFSLWIVVYLSVPSNQSVAATAQKPEDVGFVFVFVQESPILKGYAQFVLSFRSLFDF